MEKPGNIESYITHLPDEVIGYYGSGSNSYLFYAVPLTFLAGLMCQQISYGGIPFVAFALLAWYRVFFPGIYFIINHRGVVIQSAFGFQKWAYQWSEIASFRFIVKIVYGRGGSAVENRIHFGTNNGRQSIVLHLYGMEKQFDEIRQKVERLTAGRNITNGGVMHL